MKTLDMPTKGPILADKPANAQPRSAGRQVMRYGITVLSVAAVLLLLGSYLALKSWTKPRAAVALAAPPSAPLALKPTNPAATRKPFAPPGGRFSVMFPHTPQEETVTAPTKFGPVENRIFTVEGGPVEYVVNFSDIPPAALRNFNAEACFKGGIDGVRSYLNGEIRSVKAITLDGHPGREFVIALPQGKGTYRGRTYLVRGRCYQVAVQWTGVGQPPNQADQFLDSFKLTDK